MKEQIGQKLKDYRKSRGLTQLQVAKHMGWSTVQFVSNIERGLALPPKSKIKKFAKLYRVESKEIGRLYVDLFQYKMNKYI